MDIFINIPQLIFLQTQLRASPVCIPLNWLLSDSSSQLLYCYSANSQWRKQPLNIIASRIDYM